MNETKNKRIWRMKLASKFNNVTMILRWAISNYEEWARERKLHKENKWVTKEQMDNYIYTLLNTIKFGGFLMQLGNEIEQECYTELLRLKQKNIVKIDINNFAIQNQGSSWWKPIKWSLASEIREKIEQLKKNKWLRFKGIR